MQVIRFLIVFTLVFYTGIFANEVGNNTGDGIVLQSIADPTEIVNGKPMDFTTSTNDNWYVFTLGTNSKVLLFGSDAHGYDINDVWIYDESMNSIYTKSYLESESVSLNAGSYYINLSDTYTGKFSVYSTQITNPTDPDPELGSIANPYIVDNGQDMSFDIDTATNVYYFEMDVDGNVLISGSDTYGYDINDVWIYDENMNSIYVKSYLESESVSLNAGKYYMMVSDTYIGNISVYSPVMSPNPIPPTNPTYQDGFEDGQQACKDDPASCGIVPKVVVIPL